MKNDQQIIDALAASLRRVIEAFQVDAAIAPNMPVIISVETNHAAIYEAQLLLQKIHKL